MIYKHFLLFIPFVLFLNISCKEQTRYLNFLKPEENFSNHNKNVLDSLITISKKIDLLAKDTIDCREAGTTTFLKLKNTNDSIFKSYYTTRSSSGKFKMYLKNQVFKLENEVYLILSNNLDSPKEEPKKWYWKTLVVQKDSLICVRYRKFGNNQRKIVVPNEEEQHKYRNLIAMMTYYYNNPVFKKD